MLQEVLAQFMPKAHAQLRLMDQFRSIVCPGSDPQFCLTSLNLESIIVIVNIVIRVAFGFAAIIAVIYLIYSGYLFMISIGNPDAVAKAKHKLLLTVLGLVIIILAYVFVTFLIGFFGFGGGVSNPVPPTPVITNT